jgi:hypothetical protein
MGWDKLGSGRSHKFALLALGLVVSLTAFLHTAALAQSSDAAQANNPLADITAFNIQNYYVPKLTDLEDKDADNSFCAMPSRSILRAAHGFCA